MGFLEFEEFPLFGEERGIAMVLDLDNLSGLMWQPAQLIKLAKRLVIAANYEIQETI